MVQYTCAGCTRGIEQGACECAGLPGIGEVNQPPRSTVSVESCIALVRPGPIYVVLGLSFGQRSITPSRQIEVHAIYRVVERPLCLIGVLHESGAFHWELVPWYWPSRQCVFARRVHIANEFGVRFGCCRNAAAHRNLQYCSHSGLNELPPSPARIVPIDGVIATVGVVVYPSQAKGSLGVWTAEPLQRRAV